MSELILPKEKHKAEINPNSIILYGKEKCGKTTILSQLENCLIVDTENGSNKVEALSIKAPLDSGPVSKMNWLKSVAEKIIAEGKPYDYIAIDTFTEVNYWSEWSGTFRYMNSSQGKSFNRVKDEKGLPIKGGAFLDPNSDDYQSVHSLPDGNGYRWSRDEALRIFEMFQNAARKCVIYVCHVEDKFVGLNGGTEIVVPRQLALTGKLRDILPRKVDAIGYVYSDKGNIKVNFSSSEDRTGGTRAKHLVNYNDVLDWSKIFKKEKETK
jgi:hypothetical protein